jgi:hypothetical protein
MSGMSECLHTCLRAYQGRETCIERGMRWHACFCSSTAPVGVASYHLTESSLTKSLDNPMTVWENPCNAQL